MSDVIGWVVRVTMPDGTTVLYEVGYFMPGESEQAVRDWRSTADEKYEAVAAIQKGQGELSRGEVRELRNTLIRPKSA